MTKPIEIVLLSGATRRGSMNYAKTGGEEKYRWLAWEVLAKHRACQETKRGAFIVERKAEISIAFSLASTML